ncbi:FAD-dependent oxidoreductase [Sphingobium sp. B8D3B]|uniref:FAD-dependent oxidoreductase n=2 Tax=unclassified Sphingobium TaxID=2611147 RepID=UPI002224BD10|nr:FAD-dependent oxidoreductase [Sphingobium sp. B8D3B]MCW2395290.1 glycine/D-amino acid oxidase-like deaminating enzyme [Sphingobium sp. B8D3B]
MSTTIMERTAGATRGEIMLPGRRTPVYRAVDVLVCGGGLSGVAAAVAAARGGARTLLVERNVVLGGNGPLSFDIALTPAAQGIAAELVSRLERSGEAGPDLLGDGLVHDAEALKYALLDLAQEAGVQLLLSSWAADPIVEKGVVRGAMVENKSGRFAVPAGVVIDATGDGELAMRAGAAMRGLDEPASIAMNYRIGGVAFDAVLAGQATWPARLAEAKARGVLSPDQPDRLVLYGITSAGRDRGVAYVRGPSMQVDGATSVAQLGAQEARARTLIREILPLLRTLPGLEASFLIDVAGAMQAARLRHVVGAHVLGVEDAPLKSDSALIDAALRPRELSGLFVTGRAVSADPRAWAALGTGGSLQLGERAGALALAHLAARSAA